MRIRSTALCAFVASITFTATAKAEEARVHVSAGAAHAVGGTQEREFGAGGGGSATLELPVAAVLGVQASGGALVLAPGSAPADPGVAKQAAGTAFLGTVGARFRPLGGVQVAGPWIDANGGIAGTGNQARFVVDTHLGWDFRVAEKTRWDVGPFVGYTQIVQPDSSLRPDDARIVWAGIQVSLGAPGTAPVRPEPLPEQPEALVLVDHDRDGLADVEDFCPRADEWGSVPEGCPVPEVKLVGDRIVMDDIIHFELNSPAISRKSTALVRRVAALINDNAAITEVSIEGHTDALGTDEHNQELSERRAASTREMLVHFGLDPQRVRVVGHGESRLKVATPRADERNRRVEFVVTLAPGAHPGPSVPGQSGHKGAGR